MWGFEWMWEVYVPEARRRWGYYVLPMLYGERLAGRIEPRFERSTRTLRVLGISIEAGDPAAHDPRFLPALAEAVGAYRTFVGADRVTWPRTRLERAARAAARDIG